MTNTIQNVTLQLPDAQITNRDVSSSADIATSKIAQRVRATHPVPFSSMRVWDAVTSLPPATAGTDDLALLTGTQGTDSFKLSTGDLQSAGSTARKAGFELSVPPNYDDGETFEIRLRAGMETTVADTSATVDLEVWKPDGDGSVGSDLCSTAAQNCNSLTLANFDFTISAGSLDAGDRLQCVITVTVEDSASTSAVIGVVTNVARRCDTRG